MYSQNLGYNRVTNEVAQWGRTVFVFHKSFQTQHFSLFAVEKKRKSYHLFSGQDFSLSQDNGVHTNPLFLSYKGNVR